MFVRPKVTDQSDLSLSVCLSVSVSFSLSICIFKVSVRTWKTKLKFESS